MITLLPQSNNDLLAVRVTGKYSNSDFEFYRTLLKEKMEDFKTATLYFEMVDFEGWETTSFIENALFDIIHGREYGKVAMVGEKKWQEWAAKIASPVKRKGIQYFDLSEREKALKWVME